MSRLKIGDEVIKVRFSDGTFARIDGVSGNRSDFIRGAVNRALDLDLNPLVSVPAEKLKYVPSSSPPQKKSNVPASENKTVSGDLIDRDGHEVSKSDLRGDALVLLSHIRGRRLSSRQAEAHFSWPGLRYHNAERELFTYRLAWVDDGILCCTE